MEIDLTKDAALAVLHCRTLSVQDPFRHERLQTQQLKIKKSSERFSRFGRTILKINLLRIRVGVNKMRIFYAIIPSNLYPLRDECDKTARRNV